jgi:hypothetical protein
MPIGAPVVVVVVDQRSQRHSYSERQQSRGRHLSSRVSCGRLYRCAVHGGWVVLRNIDGLCLGGLNYYGLLRGRGLLIAFDAGDWRRCWLHIYFLLRSALESSRVNRAIPQSLDRAEHFRGLVVVCLSEIGGPRETVVHSLQNLRKSTERLDARIPGLLIDCSSQGIARKLRVLFKPPGGFRHLIRVGRPGQDLRNEHVGIQGDWRNEFLQLYGTRH